MLDGRRGRFSHALCFLSSRLRVKPETVNYPPLRPFTCSPPVLTPQDCSGVPAANFRRILCVPSYPVVSIPLLDRGHAASVTLCKRRSVSVNY
jgi:hypothetical protein